MEHEQNPRRVFLGPNQRYVDITLQDGTQFEGLVKNEDSYSIVLQTLNGAYRFLDRRQIRTLTNSSRTLGPENLAQRLSAQQMADLLAYLTQRKQRVAVSSDAASAGSGLSFERLKNAAQE